MVESVLGKRSRSTTKSSITCGGSRAVKRVAYSIKASENENAFPPTDTLSEDDHDELDLDLTTPLFTKAAVSCRPRAAKSLHGRNSGRVLKASEHSDNFIISDFSTQTPTPKTPRHRDALLKKVVVTPRHQVSSAASATVFSRSPHTPSTPFAPSTSVYTAARKAFTRGADAGPLIGRTKERDELNVFLSKNLSVQSGGCVYVSGPPGSGKTAMVRNVCEALGATMSFKYSCINCMSIKTSNDIFNILVSELNISDDVFGSEAKRQLEEAFLAKDTQTAFVITLDEIDQLVNIDIEALYTIFDWSMRPNSKLVLIGVANALDLTDRFLPRLKARNLKPLLLPFLPYDAAQIASVLKARTRSLLPANTEVASEFTPFIQPTAIQLISKKVAAQSGDLRKAFDIALRAIERVETEIKDKLIKQSEAYLQSPPTSPSRKPLAENMNLSSPCSSNTTSPSKRPQAVRAFQNGMDKITVENAPRATLLHVVHVTSAAFGNGIAKRIKTLNLQQQAVLCVLVAVEDAKRKDTEPGVSTPSKSMRQLNFTTPTKQVRSAAGTSTTVKELYSAYSACCKTDNLLHALSSNEFREVVGNLETLSLIAPADEKSGLGSMASKGRGSAFGTASMIDGKKLSACIGRAELEAEIKDVAGGMLLRILRSSCP